MRNAIDRYRAFRGSNVPTFAIR